MTATLSLSDAVMASIRDLGDFARTGDIQSLSNARKGIRSIYNTYGSTGVVESLYEITLRLQRAMLDTEDNEDTDDPQ